jgi:transposase-like protein
MSKFETVCPYCKKTNAVEKSSFVDEHGLQKIQCSSALTARRGGQRI